MLMYMPMETKIKDIKAPGKNLSNTNLLPNESSMKLLVKEPIAFAAVKGIFNIIPILSFSTPFKVMPLDMIISGP